MVSLNIFKHASTALAKNKDFKQILIVFGVSLCGLNMGLSIAWTSPAIPKLLQPEYGITIDEASYLAVIDPLAMMIGSPIFAKLADLIGRKRTMYFIPLLFLISWLTPALTKNIYILYISRVFVGFEYAAVFSTLPSYVGEVTTPKIRSKYGNLLVTLMFIGQFLPNFVGYFCDIPTMAYVLLEVPIITFIIIYFIPESPYFYIMKNDMDNARKSLEILRSTKNVDGELNAITAAVQRQMVEPGGFKDLFLVRSNRRALMICNLTRMVQQLCGINAFIVFAQYIFIEAGTGFPSAYGAMIFTGMLTVSNIFSNVINDKYGKRLAMVFSCTGIFFALLGETIFFVLKQYTTIDTTPANWFPVFGLAIYVFCFCLGQSNVPTLILGELFSSNIKPHGIMVMNVIFAMYMAGMNKLFQVLMSHFGLSVPFAFCTICAFTGIFLCYYFIPETKGKTLEEIQMLLKK
ncbi:facilitated trehalose transporter Tret1-like [Onthophagus taurus]|uniref:facilitated trehalose transporter Tret1-like n=1 Tax=Onthophagus taurus TaxID=166361 RepID=UPI000C203D50|nr:facilitated trehalose transporter Tret1-like [Onthophagus taurus]